MSQIYKVEKIKLKKCSFFEMQVVFIMKVEDRLQQKRKNFVAGLQEIVSVKRETGRILVFLFFDSYRLLNLQRVFLGDVTYRIKIFFAFCLYISTN